MLGDEFLCERGVRVSGINLERLLIVVHCPGNIAGMGERTGKQDSTSLLPPSLRRREVNEQDVRIFPQPVE